MDKERRSEIKRMGETSPRRNKKLFLLKGDHLLDKIVKSTDTLGYGISTDTNIKVSDESLKVQADFTFGVQGQMLFSSKSYGDEVAKKKNLIFIPNANIFMTGGYKVFYGDFLSNEKTMNDLKRVSKKFNVKLYVLRESDGRFLSAPPSDEYLEDKNKIDLLP